MSEKPSVMIVEDEVLIAMDINECLVERGYKVPAICKRGSEAVLKAAEFKPDAILMDIMLEGTMDGIEAAAEILKLIDVPIIFLTANQDKKTMESAKRIIDYGYIVKPYNDDEIIEIIEKAISLHKEKKLQKKM